MGLFALLIGLILGNCFSLDLQTLACPLVLRLLQCYDRTMLLDTMKGEYSFIPIYNERAHSGIYRTCVLSLDLTMGVSALSVFQESAPHHSITQDNVKCIVRVLFRH